MVTAPGSAYSSLIVHGDDRTAVLSGTLAHDDPTPVDGSARFDLASLTKVFTAVAALAMVDDGLDLDEPVGDAVPVGSGPGASDISLRHLLTHTAGLPAGHDAWRCGLRGDDLREVVLRSPLRARPGRGHLYSCVGYIAAGLVLEARERRPLAEIVARRVTAPLGADVTYAPEPARTVATEVQPHRGLVRGRVHDELADALEVPVGNAGLFGTADDIARLALMIGRDGHGERARVLSRASAALLRRPSAQAAGYEQAIGLRVRDASFMGGVDGVGHTGFTGTSFVLRPDTGAVAVLLTNRVHPTREGTDISALRREIAARIAPGTPASARAAR